MATPQTEANERLWSRDRVAEYANRKLYPVEIILLARYQAALSGRVLELGCGAGRVLGYLVALGGEVHGIDVSASMVQYCRREYPTAEVRIGDLRQLGHSVSGRFDAVIAADNVLDVAEPSTRRRVLHELRELLRPAGLLIFSSHNLAAVEAASGDQEAGSALAAAATVARRFGEKSAAELAVAPRRLPRRLRNRRRLRRWETRGQDHAILNDSEGDYGALHYYVRPEDQERELSRAGLELVECLDVDGLDATPERAARAPWLHYVARPASGEH